MFSGKVEDTMKARGWPSEEIEKLKEVISLHTISHVNYSSFRNYMMKYPFLDLLSVAKIFSYGLQDINLNIFGNYVNYFIKLLKDNKVSIISKILDFLKLNISLDKIFPIIESLNNEELSKLENFYYCIHTFSPSYHPDFDIQNVIDLLRKLDFYDVYLFVHFLVNNSFKLIESYNIFKKLGPDRIRAFLSVCELENENSKEYILDMLSKTNIEDLEAAEDFIPYINNIEDFEKLLNNIKYLKSKDVFYNFISSNLTFNNNKFIIYFNLFIKFKELDDYLGSAIILLNQISHNKLYTFEDYDKFLSKYTYEDIILANRLYNKNSSLSIDNFFDLVDNIPISIYFLDKFENIKGCSKISVEEAKYLNKMDNDTIYHILREFFEIFSQFNLPFSDFLLFEKEVSGNDENYDFNTKIKACKTIKNIMDITSINFKRALKLYLKGFNNLEKIQEIKLNASISVDEFKTLYYMMNKISLDEMHYFFKFLKEGIDFFDAIELAKLKNELISSNQIKIDEKKVEKDEKKVEKDEKKVEKDWYILKLTDPVCFIGMKQTEENLRDTAILYEYLIQENSKVIIPNYNFINIRDIYLNNNIPIYDFIESCYQYEKLKPDYSLSVFLNEKYKLKPENLIERLKIIDRNVEPYTKDLFFPTESFIYQNWGDQQKLINTLYRYATSDKFDKDIFPILFKNPILIGMDINKIKNILGKADDISRSRFDNELYQDAIKVYSIFKNKAILEKYRIHDLAQNILSNLPYYELKGIDIFLIKYIKYKNPKVKSVAYNWNKIPNSLKIKNDVDEMFSYLVDSKIIDRSKSLIATECDTWNISGKKFERVEQIFMEGLRVPMPEWSKIPIIQGREGFIGRFLPRNDPRVLFIGNYTDCCQKIGGAAEVVAIHSQTSPYSAVFIVERENVIIAQSWVFNDENNNIVFDNIEKDFSLFENEGDPEILLKIIFEIYKNAAIEIKKKGYKNILLGANQYGLTPREYVRSGFLQAKGFEDIVAPDYKKFLDVYTPDSMHYKLRLAMLSNKIDKNASDISDAIENFMRDFK